MTLRPLGDRVLIKPTPNPEQTESGLWLSEHRKPEESGTVIAVGTQAHPRKQDAEDLAQFLDTKLRSVCQCGLVDCWYCMGPALVRDIVRRGPIVQVGDVVLFSWAVGQEILIDDERYLLMRESDILAVCEGFPA